VPYTGYKYRQQDAKILRFYEEERIALVASVGEFYSLNRGANVDPLYDEPTNDPMYQDDRIPGTPGDEWPHDVVLRDEEAWEFIGPYLMDAAIEFQQFDNRNPSVREEGKDVEWDALVSISRNEWERVMEAAGVEGRIPKEGDVVFLQNVWWDIVKAGTQGNIIDTVTHVGFRLEVKKRTKFTPERKIG
jgi:hypothetical protein